MTRGLLDFRHVSVMLGGKRVFDDVTLTIGAGEHVAILGPNGRRVKPSKNVTFG
jgi:ABC-type molybdenum transport system ATPase subunit/photorepair protein PhrA